MCGERRAHFRQALLLMLVRTETRGQGDKRWEQTMHLHMTHCKHVPVELESAYYRLSEVPP